MIRTHNFWVKFLHFQLIFQARFGNTKISILNSIYFYVHGNDIPPRNKAPFFCRIKNNEKYLESLYQVKSKVSSFFIQ